MRALFGVGSVPILKFAIERGSRTKTVILRSRQACPPSKSVAVDEGAVQTFLQGAQVPSVIAWVSTIKRLLADLEVVAGGRHISPLSIVITEPSLLLASFPAHCCRPPPGNWSRAFLHLQLAS